MVKHPNFRIGYLKARGLKEEDGEAWSEQTSALQALGMGQPRNSITNHWRETKFVVATLFALLASLSFMFGSAPIQVECREHGIEVPREAKGSEMAARSASSSPSSLSPPSSSQPDSRTLGLDTRGGRGREVENSQLDSIGLSSASSTAQSFSPDARERADSNSNLGSARASSVAIGMGSGGSKQKQAATSNESSPKVASMSAESSNNSALKSRPHPRDSLNLRGSSEIPMESRIQFAKVKANPIDMDTAAGHHYGKHSHGKYYMFTEVPKKHSYKMGFKRGNHKHEIERKESRHKSHVSSYFKWHDKKGKGSHKFEFKHSHHKKKKKHY